MADRGNVSVSRQTLLHRALSLVTVGLVQFIFGFVCLLICSFFLSFFLCSRDGCKVPL
jgi:hypothetical protein